MSGTISRALQLLELLESSAVRTLSELSERLEVDERTVRRYIGHLRDMEIPIESVRGRHGGYRLSAGFRMPPLMLSDEEALAVVAGMLRAPSTPGITDAAAQTALSKVRRALPEATARRLDVLTRTAVFDQDHAPASAPDAAVLLTAADAVARRSPLAVRYAAQSGEVTNRVIHPRQLIAHAGRWYLLADDVAARDARTFRIDRIRTARSLPGSFAALDPSREDAVRALVEGFARAERRWHVVLRVDAEASVIRARIPAAVAVVSALPGDGSPCCRVEIHAERLDWIPSLIVSLDAPVEVETPDELRMLLADVADRLRGASALSVSSGTACL